MIREECELCAADSLRTRDEHEECHNVGREAAGTEAAGGPCAGNRISADGDVCRACVCSRRRAVTKVNVRASDRKHMHKYPQYLPVEHNNRFSDFEAPV